MESDPRLTVLLQAYIAERADDTPSMASFLSLLAAILGFLTIIGYVIANRSTLPAWAIAVAPLPPLPFIAYATITGYVAQIRGVVIDEYEKELRRYAAIPTEPDRPPIPYGHSALNTLVWQGWFARTAITISFFSLFPLYLGVIGLSFYYSHHNAPVVAWASLVVSSVSLTVFVSMFLVATFNPKPAVESFIEALRCGERSGSRVTSLLFVRVFRRVSGEQLLDDD